MILNGALLSVATVAVVVTSVPLTAVEVEVVVVFRVIDFVRVMVVVDVPAVTVGLDQVTDRVPFVVLLCVTVDVALVFELVRETLIL